MNRTRTFIIIFYLLFIHFSLSAQRTEVLLWKNIDGMHRFKSKMFVYPAPDSINTQVAVIVCPGGSYNHLMGIKTEGFGVAEYLNKLGINAFVLRYRVGKNGHHHPAMIQDLQRAVQLVRENANLYHIDTTKLGTMGFSAGGHLVTMSGVFGNYSFLKEINIETEVSLKPNFIVPVYPVVSMQDSIVHKRSRRNLLTCRYTEMGKQRFSMELNIPQDMPPVLLVTAKDDPVVKCQNSILLDKALTDKNIVHKFLLYETGRHGYGMDINRAPEAGQWRDELKPWLRNINIIQ